MPGWAATSPPALYFHYGIGPWAGLFAGVAVAAVAGTIVGYLGFRFSF